MSRRKTIRPDIAYVLERLKIAIQGLGYSFRTLENRLRYSDGYLSRVFLGTIELKIEHVLDIAKAIQIAPEELVRFVYPKPKDPISPAAYELWRRIGGTPSGALPGAAAAPAKSEGSGISEEHLEHVLRRTLGRVLGDVGEQLQKIEPK